MRKIIQNYKLFIIKGEEFESTISYNSPAKDSMETAPNLPDNSQETDEELPENKETLDKNKEMEMMITRRIPTTKKENPASRA